MKEIAAGLATLGRGPDTMLVHMAPEEVAGLQKLALAHGGSLTTNPHTGLPEAGFLKNILPTLVGVGLTMMGVPAVGVGLGSGLTSLATGKSAGESLLSGLLAGGGAAMFGPGSAAGQNVGSVINAGAATPGSYAASLGLQQGGQQAAQLAAQTGAMGLEGLAHTAGSVGAAVPSYGSLASEGVRSVAANPMQFLKDNKYGVGALGIGALGAMGGFDQPQLGVGELEPRSTARLSGRWREEIDPTAMGRTDRLIYTGDRYRGSFAEGGSTHSVPMLEDGGFVLTKKAVDGLGGQQAAKEGLGAIPIKGPGTGTSDSIPTSIDGVRPALVSNGEAYIPKREVKRRGGAKKFYALMRAAERNAARA